MLPPEGYPAALPGPVCLLRRPLYGLKQASRQWNVELSSKLLVFGFQQSSFDPCLFLQHAGSSFLALLVYVDDVLLVGTHETHILRARRFLHSTFTIKDLGYAKYFLGIEIARNPHGTYLNQHKYLFDVLYDAGLSKAKSITTCNTPNYTLTIL